MLLAQGMNYIKVKSKSPQLSIPQYVHDIQRVEMFPLTHGMQLKTI